MPRDVTYFVYILSSKTRVLYIGVTNSLIRRIAEHRDGEGGEFSRRYKTHKLVYYESFQYVNDAIRRETELKGWKRKRKVELIQTTNPKWLDLYEEFGKPAFYSPPQA